MKAYKNTNFNYRIKVKLTKEGKSIYEKHYADFDCEAPTLEIDKEGYSKFQIHNFMNIFGKNLFMGSKLPCLMNCKIQVEDEWHFVKNNVFPKTQETILIQALKKYKNEDVFYHELVTGYYNIKEKKFFTMQDEEINDVAWQGISQPIEEGYPCFCNDVEF